MTLELTKEQIELLDKLCERWEEKVSESNYNLLLQLYKDKTVVHKKYSNFKRIDLKTLKEDFVGMGKKFKTLWELLEKISRILTGEKLREVRLLQPSGTIIIVHKIGCIKWIVLSFIRESGSHTYKAFHNLEAYEDEIAEREKESMVAVKIPFTKLRVAKILIDKESGMPNKAISKEEYGGIDLSTLNKMANEAEKKTIETICPHSSAYFENFSYSPITKRIYKIDIG